MNHFYFFSYGSNLLLKRIKIRTPSVEVIEVCRLDGFELVFNKRSKDGSTKANISPKNGSHVFGVIHRINIEEKGNLDRVEGLGYGYELDYFEKIIEDKMVQIGYYIAKDKKFLSGGKPFGWYLDYVKQGARENRFPVDYQKKVQLVQFIVDTDEAEEVNTM